VADSYFAENSGVYAIEWDGGGLRVEKTGGSADIAVTAQTLAQLVTGYLSPEEAAYKACTMVYGGHDKLDMLFPKRKLFINEKF